MDKVSVDNIVVNMEVFDFIVVNKAVVSEEQNELCLFLDKICKFEIHPFAIAISEDLDEEFHVSWKLLHLFFKRPHWWIEGIERVASIAFLISDIGLWICTEDQCNPWSVWDRCWECRAFGEAGTVDLFLESVWGTLDDEF